MSRRYALRRQSLRPALISTLLVVSFASTSGPSISLLDPSTAGPALPAAAVEDWSLRRLGGVADAFRAGGLAAARRHLGDGVGSTQHALLLGLYAHAEGELELAIDALSRSADATGLLEDWRLFQLADALIASDRLAAARAVLEELLQQHPGSPLYYRAYRRQLEITYRQGDWLGALAAIEAARQKGLDSELAPELDELQWRIAEDRELDQLRRTTARHLLVEHPVVASELEAVELFRQRNGQIDWRAVFTPAELLLRSARLLAAQIVAGALSTLAAVPEAERDLDWFYLEAEALTADRRGAEALELLDARPATPHERLPELWRLRAAAALEASRVRSRRSNATSPVRQQRREIAWRDLWLLANAAEPPWQRSALVQLYELAEPEENLDVALDVLKRLRALDPTDVTGYEDLWKLGWREFSRHNTTGAIGIWRELQDLYPETSKARQALYWSAVAHAELGNDDRSRRLLRRIMETDTIDFYARHAARRLGLAVHRQLRTVTEPWPDDPILARAALLSELGLDALAGTELELQRGSSDERAADGLEALILARQGERRGSIQAAWRAFPVLGKPGQSTVPESVRQLYYPRDYREIVQRWAAAKGLPIPLVYGIIRQESAFDAGAISRAGARGLMQLMPATGRELAGRLRLTYSRPRLVQPDFSVQLGTHYFAQVLAMFDGNVELALAGYNGGPYRLKRWWREAGSRAEVDRFVEGLSLAETTSYVKRILVFEDSYRELYGERG